MQCPGCGFQNMPGSEGCVRCGSSLNVATMLIDVHPPRKGGLAGAWRRIRALRWTWAGLRDRLVRSYSTFVESRAARFHGRGTEKGILWRLPVPGWAHIFCGQIWEGCFFLAAFAACFLVGLLDWGDNLGAAMLAVAFVIHQTAVLDVLNQYSADKSFDARIRRSAWGVAFLSFCVYFPVFLLFLAVAEPMRVEFPVGPLRPGDVVLINRWTIVRPGEVVLYDAPQDDVTRTGMHERIYVQVGGLCIDRVLAAAGDQVIWADGKLLVNGIESPWQPLAPSAVSSRFSMTVPSGDVLIFPSAMQWTAEAQSNASVWSSVSCVPRDQITGTIYFRWQPVSRRGWIR
jgi:hypothetical protein